MWDDTIRVRVYETRSKAEGYRLGYAAAEARYVPLVKAAQEALEWFLGGKRLENLALRYGQTSYGPVVSALVDALAQVKEAK